MSRALATLHGRLRPPLSITDPPRDGVLVERDVAVPMRDGVVLRANVFRPDTDGAVPALLCAHPYGKDHLPKPRRRGGYAVPLQYRMMLQRTPFTFSAWTGWEAPDPVFWAGRGYAVVNLDLRGWGHSDGEPALLGEHEGRDGHDAVEWLAAQPWCSGRVGMSGVSYLAISQWATAAERPPHLAAICPWEGFTDFYRDFARPGGVREDGFLVVWSAGVRLGNRQVASVRREQKRHPLRDRWWRARDRDIEKIDVPALVCGSFSDHNLHSRGSFEGFRRIASTDKWLYTHRGPKWAAYYSPEALALQARFFDHFLRDEDTGIEREPRVRIEVREDADTIAAVRGAADWPPPHTSYRQLHLDGHTLNPSPPSSSRPRAFRTRHGRLDYTWTYLEDIEIVGPMVARLAVELPAGGDLSVFVAVRKLRDGREVGFEGSFGYPADAVTHGMLKVSHRRFEQWREAEPVHTHTLAEPLAPGEIVDLHIALLPSATLFRAGEALRLDITGHWPTRRNPLTGQFPAHYQPSPRAHAVVHGGDLTLPWSPSPGDAR